MEDVDDNDFIASEHDQLVNAVSKLDKTQHIKEPTRNEPTNQNSEFNLIKRSNKLDINNVVKVLEDTAHHVKISKKLKKSQRVLPKPLEKPQAERIKRATGYEEAKKKVGRWDAVVARSRTVDFVSFPLKNVPTKLQPAAEFLSKFELKSSLEKELEEVDPPAMVEEEEDEEQTYPMSYEEMVEHRQHLARLRAQESYKAAKAKRQSKIKSKKYHRILKKERLKQQLKEFEELQKKNPEEALEKLETLEKARALERHTLRHKNTGKWAKNKLIQAKYDKEVRQQLAEQLAVSRSLTHKTQDTESTDDEQESNEMIPDLTLSQDPMNPWMMSRPGKSNVAAEFDFGYKKYLKDKMFKRKEDSDSDSDDEPVQNNEKDNEDMKTLKESVNSIPQEETPVEEYVIDTAAIKRTIAEQNKSRKKKSMKTQKVQKVTATSNWVVEPINEEEEPAVGEKVSTAFESYESKIDSKITKKLNALRKNIEKLDKRGKASKDKKRKVDDEEHDNLEYLKLKNKKVKAVIDEELIETGKNVDSETNEKSPAEILKTAEQSGQPNADVSNIDPSKFIEVKPKYLNTAIPGAANDDELDDDEQVVPKVNIEEVFEEDDVVASFRQEKEDEINKNKPQDIDLSLPGWGSWGGKGVKAPKRKKNRFILKAPPVMLRRDENKGDIIIKEYKDPKLASHKVTNIPFPFTSIKEYEASIRAPLGNTFIPETAHKKLIKPSVITKAGTVIDPMDEDELLVKKNKRFGNANVINLLAKK
ncbi:U3 small nucleolar RNA-associated protein 14 homolog A [Ostrinia furnacalis]|uniref:U3 small nucleolar RNA-associated protein 14 homolog A n=1 Tax=Ostrinia furnacalis TaxID=93504 RepID=UPI00103F4275|nr:U3 small nucleolar RNA-associated protein 14 homolog A [Ostrinia furnacalis]